MIDFLESSKAKPIEIFPAYLKLGLSDKQLLIYSVIRGYTKNGRDKGFTSSLTYLQQWSQSSRQGALNALNELIFAGYVEKKEIPPAKNITSKIKRYKYIAYSPEEIAEKTAAVKRAAAKAARAAENRKAGAGSSRNFTERDYTDGEIKNIFKDIHDVDNINF